MFLWSRAPLTASQQRETTREKNRFVFSRDRSQSRLESANSASGVYQTCHLLYDLVLFMYRLYIKLCSHSQGGRGVRLEILRR